MLGAAPPAGALRLDGGRFGHFEGLFGEEGVDGEIVLDITRAGRVDFDENGKYDCHSGRKRRWSVKTSPSDEFELTGKGRLTVDTTYVFRPASRRSKVRRERHHLTMHVTVANGFFDVTARDDEVLLDAHGNTIDRCTTGTLYGNGERIST